MPWEVAGGFSAGAQTAHIALETLDVGKGGTLLIHGAAASHARPTPTIAVGATGALGSGDDLPTRSEIAAGLSKAYGLAAERAAAIPITGTPQQAAQRLAAYRRAGARHLVFGCSGGDWRRQCELLAEARALSDE
ncbi:hypothetical protein [Micromonospora endophytica]|uniref:hypothetical protein n=1 Tax=Micromonospora endophytica TaxID=515350 RepID=UPI001BB32475|nr:hypothetical protein [Micromonospora endophytica]BCJ56929.1 hypothetical protein Jiend_03510 [Micromonospora endophytica]